MLFKSMKKPLSEAPNAGVSTTGGPFFFNVFADPFCYYCIVLWLTFCVATMLLLEFMTCVYDDCFLTPDPMPEDTCD